MTERALSFGSVAEAYERYRPGYPAAVVWRILDYAGVELRTALEIGAGTGKATRAVAAHGLSVVATEPDPAMLEELRRHVPATVRPVCASLEELSTDTTFDLVFAAASLHWTDPGRRWARIADFLRPGGVFASFGGPLSIADPEVAAAVENARAPYLDDDGVPSPDGTPVGSEMHWPGTEMARSGFFDDVQQHVIERRVVMSRRDYVGHLSTISAYVQLPEGDRTAALAHILDALPARVELDGDITLHLGRRSASVRRSGPASR